MPESTFNRIFSGNKASNILNLGHAVSIASGVNGIVIDIILPARGSTQPLKEMSAINISWGEGGKGGQCVELTTLLTSCTDCLATWQPQPP